MGVCLSTEEEKTITASTLMGMRYDVPEKGGMAEKIQQKGQGPERTDAGRLLHVKRQTIWRYIAILFHGCNGWSDTERSGTLTITWGTKLTPGGSTRRERRQLTISIYGSMGIIGRCIHW